MKVLGAITLIVVLALGLMWLGHHRGYIDGAAATQKTADDKVSKAQADQALAEAQRDAAQQNLDNVQRTLKAQAERLKLANYFATAALDARDGLQKKLVAATAARDDAVRKAAHDSPDCADLARLPVCPAVAERLWPARAASTGASY